MVSSGPPSDTSMGLASLFGIWGEEVTYGMKLLNPDMLSW
jgi:hypothetical protein